MTQLSKVTPCRGCGRDIAFIKTQAGKSMPVDPDPVYFIAEDHGRNKYVMIDGTVHSGREPHYGDGESRIGYISHFATCPEADKFHKKNKSERTEGNR